jgi:hypothetical protein
VVLSTGRQVAIVVDAPAAQDAARVCVARMPRGGAASDD